MTKTIAAFDFDGTITTKDTLIDFLCFSFGRKAFFLGMMKISFVLVLFKLRLISNHSAKEKMFASFFKGMKIKKFTKLCQSYSIKIDKILNTRAMEKLNWHKHQGHSIVIVSASLENWIVPWAQNNDIHTIIGTQVEISNELITGKFSTKNCYGSEKVNRLLALFPNRKEYQLYTYGDSRGDRELLEASDYKFLKCF